MENQALLPQYTPAQQQYEQTTTTVTHYIYFVPQQVRGNRTGRILWRIFQLGVIFAIAYLALHALLGVVLFTVGGGWTGGWSGGKCVASVPLEGVTTQYSFLNPKGNPASFALAVKGSNIESDIKFVERSADDNSVDKHEWTVDAKVFLSSADDADQITLDLGRDSSSGNGHRYVIERKSPSGWWTWKTCVRADITVTVPHQELDKPEKFGLLSIGYISGTLDAAALRQRKFDKVAVSVVSGSLTNLDLTANNVALSTVSGSVKDSVLDATNGASISTVSGTVGDNIIRTFAADSIVKISTVSGGIRGNHITATEPGVQVSLSATSGTVRNQIDLSSLAAGKSSVKASTVSGSVDLSIGHHGYSTFKASSISGSVSIETEDKDRDVLLFEKYKPKTQVGTRKSHLANDAKANNLDVKLDTVSGSIKLLYTV